MNETEQQEMLRVRTSENQLLWAKTNYNRTRYHPLLFHMLDVEAVARLLWNECLPTSFSRRLRTGLGCDRSDNLIPFLAGAHDIGKASPGFQNKIPQLAAYLQLTIRANASFPSHGFISAHVLSQFLGSNHTMTNLLAQIAGGHHGVFPRAMDMQRCNPVAVLGNSDWTEAREVLLNEFASIIGFDRSQLMPDIRDIADPLVVPVLAGFISVVDWIGSNQEYFPCEAAFGNARSVSAKEYWQRAQERARKALEHLGWLPAVKFTGEAQFKTIFRFSPNTLQDITITLAQKQNSPYLMIIEAPMGLGKTEAALYAADIALCRGFARGIYVAMPTQATGNAMFRRVLDDYLKGRGHQGNLNVQLVHGDALLASSSNTKEGEIQDFRTNSDENEETSASFEAQSWFMAKKRPLLAPFGVGTIDQSLLSVLQTRHWFVRLFGLTGKVVVFDEVHAYDAYMRTILERLLQWLAELGCTVILLSATLPEEKRKALIKAYSRSEDPVTASYPRISLAQPRHYSINSTPSAVECVPVPAGESKTIYLQFAGTDLSALTTILSEKLANGGCMAVICNTVDRSIEVFKHLRDNLQKTECLLFHARTLKMWRREREEEVLRKFGKGNRRADGTYFNPDRPKRAVLVATQVIEQSLDLDFDLMVSEIAPIDLLLQRAGRLHRHLRPRPQGLETPQFTVLCDDTLDGPPPNSFGESIEYVYDRYVLLRTWLALRSKSMLEVPSEIEDLVEKVYGVNTVTAVDWVEALNQARAQLEYKRKESEKTAGKLLVSAPRDPQDLIEEFNNQLADDDDPEVHKSIRASTREGDPSIAVVMLPENERQSANPQIPEVRKLLDRSVNLSRKGLFQEIRDNGEQPVEWRKNAHLRHTRLLRLDEHSRGRIGNYTLEVNEETGVSVYKEHEQNV